MLDPYQILKVAPDATPDEIKASYRKLAKELHPDLNPGNATKARRFKEVTAAYDVLSDETKRRQHDAETAAGIFRRRSAENRASESRAHEARRERAGGGDADFDFFSDVGGSGKPRGADIYQSLRISFVEAVLGVKKRLTIQEERSIDVTIPPLTEHGQTLRMKGQGGRSGRFGPAGDLFVDVAVDPHAYFTRIANDIHMVLPVTVQEAVLGAAIKVPTLHGLVQVKVPAGSNTDTILRLRGKGVPGATAPGDQLVKLKVVLPETKDKDFIALVTEWGGDSGYTVRPNYQD